MKPLIVDAHQDLAWNILTFGRDYTQPAAETRRREQGGLAPQHNGDTLLGWADYQAGRVGLVFATLFASPARRALGDWDTLCYRDTEHAYQIYRRQLGVYHDLVERHPEKFRLITDRLSLETHLQDWLAPDAAGPAVGVLPAAENLPVGLVVLMENAEGVRHTDELAEWTAAGVRLVGPAWAGTRFCGGTREPGPLTKEGYALLDGLAAHNLILDLSHMDEQAVLQALDYYPGTLVASHANAQVLLKGLESNRHLSDRVIAGLVERGAVIGVVPANGFLLPDWKARGGKAAVSLDLVVAQIDYICQLAGSPAHVGLGSDFDGGFGWQHVPAEINTVADLQLLAPRLAAKGYQPADIEKIFGLNWINILRKTWKSA